VYCLCKTPHSRCQALQSLHQMLVLPGGMLCKFLNNPNCWIRPLTSVSWKQFSQTKINFGLLKWFPKIWSQRNSPLRWIQNLIVKHREIQCKAKPNRVCWCQISYSSVRSSLHNVQQWEHIKHPDIPIIHQKTRLKFHAMTRKLNTKVLKSSYAALWMGCIKMFSVWTKRIAQENPPGLIASK